MFGTKAAVVTGTATKVGATKAATAVKGYAKQAGAVAGHGVKVYGSKAAIAAGMEPRLLVIKSKNVLQRLPFPAVMLQWLGPGMLSRVLRSGLDVQLDRRQCR